LKITVTLVGQPSWKLSALKQAAKATVTVPEEYYSPDRTFIVYRFHNGEVMEVGRGKGRSIPIETDKFSTYSLAYINAGNEKIDSNNSSSSKVDDGDSSSSVTDSDWTPKTPDEVKRYSVVGKEILVPLVDKSSGYTLTVKNAMQGPNCFAAFESVLDGYTIGRTYDIFPNGQRVQSTDKEVGFSIEVPKALQKDGRTFQMICVTKGGQPVVLKDLDNNPNTVTIKTDKFYAFALVYKDAVKTK
ncbi:MAG: hypothetical protein J6N21_14510, partial [Butyrivibrio sp.]|nr:hypothetical protein [Butyrivibrio sp.]